MGALNNLLMLGVAYAEVIMELFPAMQRPCNAVRIPI